MALFAFDGTAAARTITFEGDYGLNRQQPEAAEVYDATGATVNVEQGTSNACWNIRPDNPPESAEFIGGRCIGVGKNRTWARKPLYDQGNGAAIRWEINNFILRRFYTEFAWDPIKPAAGNDVFRIEESWVRGGRDDCIEADHHLLRATVRNSLFEDCHYWISVSPGGSADNRNNFTIDVQDSLIHVGCNLDDDRPCMTRLKRSGYQYADPYRGTEGVALGEPNKGGYASGALWKVRNEDQMTVRWVNNHVAMGAVVLPDGSFRPSYFHANPKNLLSLQEQLGATITPDSTGNTFYWLGECDDSHFNMVDLHGACVPDVLALDPEVYTAAYSGAEARERWLAVRGQWISQVWQGNPAPAPDPQPEPDPAPDPEPEPADEIAVPVDVRPQQCVNRARIYRDSGTISVAIAGTDSVNVRDIEIESISLEGVAPQLDRTSFNDLVTPFEPYLGKQDKRDCTREGADGFEDLLLRFDVQELAEALGPLPDGMVVVLRLTGRLVDDTRIKGEDVVVITR